MQTDTPDLALQIYQAIADGMVNDSQWKVTEDNFIRYDQLEGIQTPDKIATTEADYPQAILRGPIDFKTDLQTGTETFGTYSTDGCDWMETGEWVFELKITSDLLRVQNYSPQTAESINAIRRLGPRLGLPFVTGVKIKGTERDSDIDEEDGVRRIITNIRITVTTQHDGQSMTGGN